MLRQSPSTARPEARWRPLLLVTAALAQLALLFWAAGVAVPQTLSCEVCDSEYYNTAAAEFTKSGLLFVNPFEGYRSYFVPFFVASIQRLAAAAGVPGDAVRHYAWGVALLFWGVSTGLLAWAMARAGTATAFRAAAATLLNPFLVVYVPFMLQEGVLMASCLPLLFVWAVAKDMQPEKRAGLVCLMALLAYTIRASLLWWVLPAVAYALWVIRSHRREVRRWAPAMAIVLLAGSLLIGPQVYVSKQKSGTLNPYPSTGVFALQVNVGISLLKYATVEDGGHWRGLVYWSPFAAEPEETKNLRFYVEHPGRGVFLAAAHAYAGFHYDQVLPYWRIERARPLTIWLVLSSAIVFLGVARMVYDVMRRRVDADGGFMIATLLLCIGSLLFLAVEARFGILGFAMLSLGAAAWFPLRRPRRQWLLAAACLAMYVVLSFLYNTLLLQSADLLL
jgi:hypothetical protein